MLNIVIFGAPGSGKGTQSAKLVEKYGLKHLSTGDILRNEIKADTELGKLADSYMSKGHLVPDELVIDILDNLIGKHRDAKGFIFDGFPRTLAQGEALGKMLEKHGEAIDAVLSLEVEEEELIDRLLKRGQISGRADDNRETIESRLKVYHAQTEPLKEFYRTRGTLKNIEGVGSIDDIFGSIEKEIDRLEK
ncbi:Adenylate kinase [Proteiniphilum saccharofermentans]|uniref:Adenylate kinase n=1 Tax=Proteiniphilum saccharofermentans TaxID=1642647 RepID=A0A1R3T5I0_9BACT|nr:MULTISPECIES: adenylate kinase [Proteiniphilum]SCD19225.1 Adenylate kinase [Proteiniphilum saccharofermentans]